MAQELTPADKERINAELVYSELARRHLEPPVPKTRLTRWMSSFFGHAFVIAFFGGLLIQIFQIGQSLWQEHTTRKEQFQAKQYALLASFSGDFDTYISVIENIRWDQNFLLRSKKDTNATDSLGRSRAELMPHYEENVKQLHEHPRGEAVLVSILALFRSSNVIHCVNELDTNVLKLQHADPPDHCLSDDDIENTSQEIDRQVRTLAVAMREEMETNK